METQISEYTNANYNVNDDVDNKSRINAVDIIYLNEAVKTLKQKTVAVYNGYVIGLDNIEQYVRYIQLDYNLISNTFFTIKAVIDAVELSMFVSSMTTESCFVYDMYNERGNIFKNLRGLGLVLYNNRNVLRYAINKLGMCQQYDYKYKNVPMTNIDEDIIKLKSMRKMDGTFHLIHDGQWITMFPGLLPMVKSDKVYLSIYNTSETSFVAKFTVKKKKFDVYVYLAYLKVN
jgi:hypothetical protein